MEPELLAVAIAILLATGLLVVAVAVAMAALHPIKPPVFDDIPPTAAACGPSHPLRASMR